MLTEDEWAIVHPLLKNAIERIKRHRKETGISLGEALDSGIGYKAALEEYENITGYKETNGLALWHHRLSEFGPPCVSCGKPLRTPKAQWCAFCGTMKVIDEDR